MSAQMWQELHDGLSWDSPLDFEMWPQQSSEVLALKPTAPLVLFDDPLGLSSKAGLAKAAKTNFSDIQDEDEKAELKKKMNKLAADRYRRKKREQFEGLQEKVDELSESNRLLTNKCSVLETQVAYLKDLLMATVSNGRQGAIDRGVRDTMGARSATQTVAQPKASLPATTMTRETFDLTVFAKEYLENREAQTETRLRRLETDVASLREEDSPSHGDTSVGDIAQSDGKEGAGDSEEVEGDE